MPTKNKLIKASLFLSLLVLFFSCNKGSSSIGLDVQPEGDLLSASYCDTNSVISYSITEDSMRSDENSLSVNYALLGTMADPVFGRTDASLFTSFVMPNNIVGSGFGSNPKLDSVVLSLTYNTSYYGDKTDALKFNVYKLSDYIYYDSSYYSTRIKAYDPNDVTYSGQGITAVPSPTATVQVGDNSVKAHLRLKLKDEIGQYFMDDTTRIASTQALQLAFKGLLITTKNTTVTADYGSLVYFDMTNAQTKLTIYYHNSPNTDVRTVDLGVGSGAPRYNHFAHDYSNAYDSLRQQALAPKDTSRGKGNIFLQGLAGLKARINFPYLQHLADSGPISINKAELSFKVNKSPSFYNLINFPLPPRLILDGVNQYGGTEPLAEAGDAYTYGGIYNSTTGEYVFNIPYTAQKIISKKFPNYKFVLSVFERQLYPTVIRQLNPGRLVLGGSENPSYPIKLKIWYTKLY
ncbi:MAG: DUF4270 family protein [Bacteroidia bacterium]